MTYRFVVWVIGLFVAGCGTIAPAQTPAQLAATPGEFVTVTAHTVETDSFTFSYPYTWRIVKSSPAGKPLQFIIISPDETQLIAVSEAEYTLPPSERSYQRGGTVTVGGDTVYISGESTSDQQEAFDAVFDFVIASIQPTP